ncbi:hypothetical protein [Roseovarius sp. SYSU LYC5161]|uniref:hypothetical protein n=1 Tax=Roseovarius halophilus (ex Wu et al. 2025) TaxID=3376060 RepID=UPI00399B8FF8
MNFPRSWVTAPLFAAAGGLAACAVDMEPAVSSFNEASVGIQIDGNALEFADEASRAEAIRKADARAAEVCARGPNRKAEFASSRQIPTGQYSYVVERLYLCLS